MKLKLGIAAVAVVVITLLFILVNNHEISRDNDNITYNYSLDSFWITFNGESKDNLTAVLAFNRILGNPRGEPNNNFKDFFQNEASSIKIKEINQTSISFYSTIDGVNINVDYIPGLSNSEKNATLFRLINYFKEKWYVLAVGVNLRGTRNSFSGLSDFEPIIEEKTELGTVIDKAVFDRLNVDSYLDVQIMLKDNSQLKYEENMSSEERYEILQKKKEYFSEFRKRFLSNFTSDEMKVNYMYSTINGFDATISKSGFQKLQLDKDVLSIHVSRKGTRNLAQSVPLINASDVWNVRINDMNITGVDVTICIIDTGINYSHHDLGHCNITSNINDGSCYKVIGGHDFANNDDNPYDSDGHGTMISGIISANGSIKGVAPDSKIVMIQDGMDIYDADEEDTAAGVDWCTDNRTLYNISIISISSAYAFSSEEACFPDRTLSATIKEAFDQGILVVAASGNQYYTTQIGYPSCVNGSTSVGAVYDYDTIPSFSNTDEFLDLLAPGVFINSTDATGGYFEDSGTSFSTPHVAGAVALLIQYEKVKNNKTLTPTQIETRFKNTGKLIFDDRINLTFSRIDVYAALFPIDVFDLQRLKASSNHNIFGFKIQNNYNTQTKDVSWSFDVGNGTTINSDYDVTLLPKKNVFVYFEYNYTDGDIYSINATASSGEDIDSETMTIPIGDLIAYDMKLLGSSSTERVFGFKILNNMNETKAVNWTLNTGQGTITSDYSVYLNSSKTVFVYAHYNYTSGGSYIVNATAISGGVSDSTRNIAIDV